MVALGRHTYGCHPATTSCSDRQGSGAVRRNASRSLTLHAVAPPNGAARQVIDSAASRRFHGLSSRQRGSTLCRSGEFDAEEKKPDFIERLVVGIFGKHGKKVLEDQEPMGMKRMSAQEFPEIYPATVTEFAEPVEGDDEAVAIFRPLLARTQLEAKRLQLCYSADECGWDADAFHRCVDGMGAAVVMARTAGGAVLGGYNPKGWIGIGEDRDAIAAFLFTWPDGDTAKPAIKLPKVGGASLAVVDKADYGIQFGAEGLTIPLGSTGKDPKHAKSRLGTYYAKAPGGGRSLFAEGESNKGTELVDLKVWVAEGNGETWQLDGIVWKTSTQQ